MTDDLTDNDIVIRQINCAHILRRNLERLLSSGLRGSLESRGSEEKDAEVDTFTFDYYGDQNYWMRYGIPMRIIMLIFPVLYIVQCTVLRLLLFLTTPLKKLNLVI